MQSIHALCIFKFNQAVHELNANDATVVSSQKNTLDLLYLLPYFKNSTSTAPVVRRDIAPYY